MPGLSPADAIEIESYFFGKVKRMIQNLASWIWSLFGSDSVRQQYVQLPIDKFITWCSVGMPIMLLIFTQKYSAFIGRSDSLICAPPASGGFVIDGTSGVVRGYIVSLIQIIHYKVYCLFCDK